MIKGTVEYKGLDTVLCKRNFGNSDGPIFTKGKEYFILSVQEDGLIICHNEILVDNEIRWSDSYKFWFGQAEKYFPAAKTYFIIGLKERRKAKLKKLK